ncbi:MAG: enoyl-CoA hydratase/isomerase family protein [Magnetococcales bacterium]|nr:enoyl-CoA hydratase/isomerase family protein [Magnetococcales bacterium]
MAGSGANLLSGETLEELDHALILLEAAAPRGVAVLSGKAGGFIAGADVHPFEGLSTAEQALPLAQRGQAVLSRLAHLPFPSLAVIQGYALGGGLELALACTRRVAVDRPETRLGLPEIKLGIHPGFGGTVRLPRLIGPLAALDMMLTGRTLSARAALKLGLVDQVIPERQVEAAIAALAARPAQPRRLPWSARMAGGFPLRPVVAWRLHRQVEAVAPRLHYPAPHALIELWRHQPSREDLALEAEAHSLAELLTGESSRGLVRLFLLRNRLKTLAPGSDPPPRGVHVAGDGVMGRAIAVWCARQGMTVTLQGIGVERLGLAVREGFALFQRELKDPVRIREAMDRLIPDPDGWGAAKAEVVIEAIFEDLTAKQILLRQLESRLKPGAILATNTSSIPLEDLARGLTRPDRLAGLHFFNPVARMPLVEVVRGAQTSEETRRKAARFAAAIDRLPLPVKSAPGFLVNRILVPYLLEAAAMVEEGVSVAAVDGAAVRFGMPMGPLRLADLVGLDVCASIARFMEKRMGWGLPAILLRLVEEHHLGEKSGQGFYRHEGGKARPAAASSVATGKTPPPEEIADRLILRMLNEAVACLREGVVEDADLLDAGMVFGAGFAPFRGGLLRHAAREGLDPLLERLRQLSQKHGPRFLPDPGWSDPAVRRMVQSLKEPDHETTDFRSHHPGGGLDAARLVPGAG